MGLNRKGFAITAVLYGLLILFVLLVSSYLLVLSARKNRLDNIIEDMEEEYAKSNNRYNISVTITDPLGEDLTDAHINDINNSNSSLFTTDDYNPIKFKIILVGRYVYLDIKCFDNESKKLDNIEILCGDGNNNSVCQEGEISDKTIIISGFKNNANCEMRMQDYLEWSDENTQHQQ